MLCCSVTLELEKIKRFKQLVRNLTFLKVNFSSGNASFKGIGPTFIPIFFSPSKFPFQYTIKKKESRIPVSFPVIAPRKPSFSFLRNAHNTTQWSEIIIPNRSVIS